MNFPLYIAKRYLRTASKNNAINLINGIASISIVVGAAALFVVLSVFSGLKDFSLSFSNDFDRRTVRRHASTVVWAWAYPSFGTWSKRMAGPSMRSALVKVKGRR